MPSHEARAILSASEKRLPRLAQPVGTPDPQQPVEVTLRLRPRQPLPEPGTGAALSRAEFARRYGASEADLAAVQAFLQAHRLEAVQVSAARRTVVARGTLEQVQAAFGVQLAMYRAQGATFRARSGALSLPAELGGVVEGVFGLDDRPQARAHFRLVGAPGVALPHTVSQAFTPPELARAYGFPAGDGAGQTVALIELGGGYLQADLEHYFQALGLPMPAVQAVSVDGAQNAPTGDPNSADGEVMLDIEVTGAISPGARIAVYFAPNTDAGFLNAVTLAAHDDTLRPSVISISWGAAEPAWTQQALQAMSGAFQEAALMGVTVLCAAGDNGSGDGAPDGQPHTDFPASSPYATGCGGTRLSLRAGHISQEVVWNDPRGGATGGGVSAVFGLPDYQQGAGVPPPASAGGGRGVPDVAGVADPATGYRVRVDGLDTTIGGTSAVAPLWAGLVARLNARRGAALGFLNPALYRLGPLRDITQGSNGAYHAGPGWDACTGLGSPDGARLSAALSESG